MPYIKPKKYLGQHFLKDENIALKIVKSLACSEKQKNGDSSGVSSPSSASMRTGERYKVLEVGPGTGILTKYLLEEKGLEIFVIEIDTESVKYIKEHFPELSTSGEKNRIISDDFLKIDLSDYFSEPFALIGNFPYNISSQILFKVYENRNLITEVVGMFQKEVAQRIASPPGNKTYGILSVLMQAFYNVEYLFTVNANVFSPPPKVQSAVVSFRKNDRETLDCDEKLFLKVVKAGFNQRRKMLSNALKSFISQPKTIKHPLLSKRAEQLSVEQFVEMTNLIEGS